jgi:hypothetical protein
VHNEDLHNVYSSPCIITMMTARETRRARMEELRKAYKILVGKPEGDRLLWKLTRTWGNLKEMRHEGVDYIHLARASVGH